MYSTWYGRRQIDRQYGFNVDCGRYTADLGVKMFADRISKQSVLDHIYVNNSVMNSVVLPAVITHFLSDHFPTLVHLKFKRQDENSPLIRIIKPHLKENFFEDINSELQSLEAPNFEKLSKVLTVIVNEHFPRTNYPENNQTLQKNPG